MSRYMATKYKQKSHQRALIDKADQRKPSKMSYTEAKRAKAFWDRQRAEQESACQLSTSNATTATDSPMQLHIKMQSANTDMEAEEPMGSVGVQLGAPKVRPLTHELRYIQYICVCVCVCN
jgi:hypothetical protein